MQIDPRLLDLRRRPENTRSKEIESRSGRAVTADGERLREVVRNAGREAEQRIGVGIHVEDTAPGAHYCLRTDRPRHAEARCEVVLIGVRAAFGITALAAYEKRRLVGCQRAVREDL